MGVRFTQNLTGKTALEPGEFYVETTADIEPVRIIWMRCKECGFTDVLPKSHTMHPGGRVTPALACAGCSFCDFVELTQ